MRIIPVIDIMGGVAVHAKGGQRDYYKPIKSRLCETSNPIDVALTLKSKFGFRELYIADLDSIMGRGDNMDTLRKIHESSSMEIMGDSGINDVGKVRDLLHVGVEKVVVGTETLTSFKVLKKILDFAGHERIIVSIDHKNGKILSKCKEIVRLSPEALAKRLKLMSIKELVLLDLSRVGSESGVNAKLIRRVLDSVDVPIITGGGIRNIDDVLLLYDLGISGALISTALHNLKIKREDFLKL